MKLRQIVFLGGIISSQLSFGSQFMEETPLRKYCIEDPEGKLYTEIYQASHDKEAFEVVGLNPENYSDQFDQNGFLKEAGSIYEFAYKFQNQFPEIRMAIDLWELNICIDRAPQFVNSCQ